MNVKPLLDRYPDGEAFSVEEIPFKNKNHLRQELKKLVDQNVLSRLDAGVYYKNYVTLWGTEGVASYKRYLENYFLQNGTSRFSICYL